MEYQNIVTLYVPEEKIFQDCTITLSDGNISLEGLQSEKTEINLSYGDISLNNASLNQGSIVLGDGDIKAKDSKFVKNNLESHYGEITLENVSFEDGTIALEDGDLKADMILFEKTVQIKSSYGEVYLKMDEEAVKNLNIVADTEYGEINESGTQHYQYENAGAPNYLTIKSSDGDIILK